MRFVYTGIWLLALPLLLLRLWWRGRLLPAYRQRWGERLGRVRIRAVDVWVHAVSVGETLAAEPLVERLLAAGHRVLVTTTTPTGSAQVQRLFGARVQHVYLPWDVPWLLQPLLQQAQARLLVIMETELWPNLLALAQERGMKVVLANARLSARSARGYRRLGALTRDMLRSLDSVLAQDESTRQHFIESGLPAQRVVVCGSVKNDIVADAGDEQAGHAFRSQWQATFVLLAASTHDDEEMQIVEACRPLLQAQKIQLLLAPRHPERAARLAEKITAAGFPVCRRSQEEAPEPNSIYLLDTLGEIKRYYAAADVVFVGGSLVDVGGHNVLEPAAFARPVLCGPHGFNFQSAIDALQAAGGLVVVGIAAELAQTVSAWQQQPAEAVLCGEKAHVWLTQQRGATDRQFAKLTALLNNTSADVQNGTAAH